MVVLARLIDSDQTRLIVAPVTHSEPPPGEGVAMPVAVKRNLRLDREASWIVTTEVNQFVWPGPDIRPAKGLETPLYGAIPARLFDEIRRQIADHAATKQAAVVKRTE